MNNKVISRMWLGLKSGWDLPILPEHISKLDSNIYIRVFKFIGTISMFIIVSGIGFQFNPILFYIFIILSMSYIFYRFVLIFYIIKQWFCNLFQGKWIVRNSPLDHLATILRLSSNSFKTAVNVTVGAGFTYALCHELDDILVKEGNEPYFVPGIKSTIVKVGLEEKLKNFLNSIGIKELKDRSNYSNVHETFRNLNIK